MRPIASAPILAKYVRSITWDGLDPLTRQRTAELVLDLLGVAAAGSNVASSRAVAGLLDRPDSGICTVIGRSGGYPPEMAALVNGTAGHAIELDDVTRESSLHPGVVVIPSALATGESVNASVAAVGEAVVAGYEITIRVGNALGPASAYRRGFHPTGVAGVFGAATAAGLLLGLDAGQLSWALGIAGTMASGSLEYLADGSWTKRLNAGWAAHNGILAARLAKKGFTGPPSSLDGHLGVLSAYTDDPHPQRLLDDLGHRLAIMTVAVKPYACCRYNHGLIDAMIALRTEERLDVEEVSHINLGVLSGGTLLVADPIDEKRKPQSVVDAQFSAPYAAAVALVYGRAGPAEYTEEAMRDARLRDLMAKTDCFSSDDLDRDFPSRWPAQVQIELQDGRILQRTIEYALGEPENPMLREDLMDKFLDLASAIGVDEAAAQDILRFQPDGQIRELLRPFRTLHAVG